MAFVIDIEIVLDKDGLRRYCRIFPPGRPPSLRRYADGQMTREADVVADAMMAAVHYRNPEGFHGGIYRPTIKPCMFCGLIKHA
jgi:hypothetical protein